MDSGEFRNAAHSAIDEIIDYYNTIQDRRVVSNVTPGYLRNLLPSGPPENGEEWNEIQQDIESKIMPGLTHWQSPNFMAFFPSNVSYPSILGELYSAAFTAPAFNWICSPAVTELETIVLDWVARLFNLPACYLSEGEGGGVILGTASEAIVTVMIAARERYLNRACEGLEGEEREEQRFRIQNRLVALGSDQSHSSTAKAALILGVRYLSVPTYMEDDLSMAGENLLETLGKCRSKGLEPFFLTTCLGTTSTCASDYFSEIEHVLDPSNYPEPGMWVHVDAAYAGAALICEEYQHFTKSFRAFDSFEVNMHKWLLTNFDAGCLWVKRRRDLTSALSITPAYLCNDYSESGLVTDYRDWQIPLGRRFRSLKIWFVLRSYGVSGLKAYIRNHIRLGMVFHRWVESRSDLFSVLTPPAFALTVFTVKPQSEECDPYEEVMLSQLPIEERVTAVEMISQYEERKVKRANEVTRKVYEAINAGGEIFLTSTMVKGVYAIRVVSANTKTDEEHMRRAFELLAQKAQEVIRQEYHEYSVAHVHEVNRETKR